MSSSHKTYFPILMGLGIAVACSTIASTAVADKSALAEDLFDKGIQLMEQGKYDRACPHLEESYRRDPLLGALIALADCEYERGRLATALKRYQEYVNRHDNLADVARQKQGSRLREAKAKVDELTSAVPTIKITIPPEAKIPILHLDGLRIKPDEVYPVDPGKYEVTLDMFGRKTSRVIVEARKGQKKIVPLDLGKTLPPTTKVLKNAADIDEEPFDYEWDEKVRKTWTVVGCVELGLILTTAIVLSFTADTQGAVAIGSQQLRTMSPPAAPPAESSPAPSMLIPSVIAGTGAIALATGGILWAAQSHRANTPAKASIFPLMNVGQTPEQPTIFGVQGRF